MYRLFPKCTVACLSFFLALVLSPPGAFGADEKPWWDDFLTIIQVDDAKRARESQASAVLAGVADDPTWGLFQQRERMVHGVKTVQELHAQDQKVMVWFEGFGTTQTNIAQVKKNPDGSWIKHPLDDSLPRIFNSFWSWQNYDGTGEIRWIGSQNYFDNDDLVEPWTRLHPLYGCPKMIYPDGTVAEGYFENSSDPRKSKVWDAGCSKTVLGDVSFEYSYHDKVNQIDPETKKLVGPLDGLLEIHEEYLGPPDPGYTPEEWKKLKSSQYAGLVSAGKDTACPIWFDYLRASLKDALTADVDGLWVDNYSPWDNFCSHPNIKAFGEWSVASFRPFLRECVEKGVIQKTELEKLGVNDLSTFDVREYMKTLCRQWGGTPENLSDHRWRDPRWQDDLIWRAFLIHKRQLGTKAFDKYYAIVKEIAKEAGKPDFFVSGNDIPMYSLGWIRGELDMVSTELTWGWHLTSGPRGLMPPPLGSYVPIAKLGREHAKSRFVNAWYYVPKDQENKPNIARVVNYQGLANHMLPMPQFSAHTIGTPEVNADFFGFIKNNRSVLTDRVPYDEQIGLYYSSSTQLMEMLPGGFRDHNAQPHSFSFYGWGTMLTWAHHGWRAIPQWKLTPENLAPLKVMIVPNVSVFDRAQLTVLENWVRNGGTLVISGSFAERLDEDGLFAKAEPLDTAFAPPKSDADISEKTLQKGKIVFVKKDPGYDFYLLDKERVAKLETTKPLLRKIMNGHMFRLDAQSLPLETGVTCYSDANKVFVDLNNTNIKMDSDTIVPNPSVSFQLELPEDFRDKKTELRILSPESTVPRVKIKSLEGNRVQIETEPFEVYLGVVIEKT